jgi:hypothetical protein
MAIALSRPALISAMTVEIPANIICTRPPIRSLSAGAIPL